MGYILSIQYQNNKGKGMGYRNEGVWRYLFGLIIFYDGEHEEKFCRVEGPYVDYG